jgi:hypothetical protein
VSLPHFPDSDPSRPFDGGGFETADPALASLLTRAKQTLTERPRDEVASAHVAQMMQAARCRPAVIQPRILPVAPRRRGLRTFRRAVVGFALVVLAGASSMAGLAFAGVQLPSAVLTAFNKAGIHLPNQGQDAARTGAPSSSSEHGQDVESIATTGPHGCVHGEAVSAAAGVNRQDSAADAHRESASHQSADPCAQSHDQSGSGTGTSSTAAGSQESQGTSNTGDAGMQSHRGRGSGRTPSPGTHGRSGNSGNQGKGKGGSQRGSRTEHPGATGGRGRAGQHGPG